MGVRRSISVLVAAAVICAWHLKWIPQVLLACAGLSRTSGVLVLVILSLWWGLQVGVVLVAGVFLKRRHSVEFFVALPLLWGVCESYVPNPFDISPAYLVWRISVLAQIAEFGGLAAVSGVSLLISLLVLHATTCVFLGRKPSRGFFLALMVGACVVCGGFYRGRDVQRQLVSAKRSNVGLVQPNFGILSRRERERQGSYYSRVLRGLSQRVLSSGGEFIVWPESCWPFLFDRTITNDFPEGHPWNLRGDAKYRAVWSAFPVV